MTPYIWRDESKVCLGYKLHGPTQKERDGAVLEYFSPYPNDLIGGLILKGVGCQVHFDGEKFGILHEMSAFLVECGKATHQTAKLEHDILDVLVVQELQFDEHIRSKFGEAFSRIRSTTENQPILVIARFHAIQGLTQGSIRNILVVHFFDFKAIGQVLEFDIRVFLNGQLRVGDGFRNVGAQVLKDLNK